MQIKTARARLAELRAEGRDLMAKIRSEDRDATEDEELKLLELEEECDKAAAYVERLEAQMDRERKFAAEPVAAERAPITGAPVAESDVAHGWRDFGEFCKAVHAASHTSGYRDERLSLGAAPTTFGQEAAGADGGFLVPPAFGSEILSHALEEDSLLAMSDQDQIAGNAMSWPRDEETPWTSAGIRMLWEAEAAQATQTKPVLGRLDLRLHKLMGLVPMTDELLEDATAAGAFVQRKLSQSLRWKTNDALVNGSGAGEPLGILNAGCLVAVAKETSQTADTVVVENVVKMFARSTAPGRSVWVCNPDVVPQIYHMKDNAGTAVYQTPQPGLPNAPAGILLGRPVFLSDAAQTVGDQGDIILCDWSAYKSATKRGGLATATSMHLWFDYAVTAFRAIYRCDGQPWLRAAITPPNSALTRSPFVTVAARA